MSALIEIEFEGLPPTVNHMYGTARKYRYKSLEAREYQEYAINKIREQWQNKPVCTEPVCLSILPEARKSDDAQHRRNHDICGKQRQRRRHKSAQQKHPPDFHAEIIFAFDDQRMEHSDDQKANQPDDNALPMHEHSFYKTRSISL